MVLQRGRHWRPGHCAGIAADAGVARRARRRRVRGCGASHPVRPGRGPASARTCGRRGRRTGQNRLTRHRSASWRRIGQRILDPGHANDGSTDHTIPGSTSQDRPKRNQRSSDRYHRSRNGGYRYRCARYRYRSAGIGTGAPGIGTGAPGIGTGAPGIGTGAPMGTGAAAGTGPGATNGTPAMSVSAALHAPVAAGPPAATGSPAATGASPAMPWMHA